MADAQVGEIVQPGQGIVEGEAGVELQAQGSAGSIMGGLLGIPAAAFEQAQAPVDLRRSEHLRGVFRPAPPPVRVGVAGAGQVRLLQAAQGVLQGQ
uniref:Uncharacterized protein n=1 Tax=Pseudomonas aeruginosa TaxID=287 RepID=A0A5E5QUW4_PSEAI|nr:hypothetical protein TUEID40_00365 [Pseudomonas aeruginosa]